MQRPAKIIRIAQLLAGLLVCKTTVAILLNFPNYFPPNFRTDFLFGRQTYFFGPYQWAFYTHIISGPITLLVGLALLSGNVRCRYPALHRCLGRFQVACVLIFVAPSGLWMAWYAMTGIVAALGFAILAVATAACVAMGWRAARQRHFDQHRRWMLRCYILLCSAVTIRVLGGLSEVLSLEQTYPFAAWFSWILPLFVLELLSLSPLTIRHQQ